MKTKIIPLLIIFTFSSFFIAAQEFNGNRNYLTGEYIYPGSPRSIAVLDIDLDGDVDIRAVTSRGVIVKYTNDGQMNFEKTPHIFPGDGENISIWTIDMDDDGDLDIAGSYFYGATVYYYWLEVTENGTISHPVSYSSYSGSPVDLDGDGDKDILSIYNDDTDVYLIWKENDGGNNYTSHTIAPEMRGIRGYEAVDVDYDGDLDVVSIFDFQYRDVYWHENDGQGNFTTHTLIASEGENIDTFSIFDIDGDGDFDIVQIKENSIMSYENDGNLNFNLQVHHENLSGYKFYYYDLDQDGSMDVVAASGSSDPVFWYHNDGSGNFSERYVISANQSAYVIRMSDLDQDGDMDLVCGSDYSQFVWLENDGEENFTTHRISNLISVADPQALHAVDVDTDGDMDVLAASLGGNSVSWHENLGGGEFRGHPIPDGLSQAHAVFGVDMDGDGDIDVVSASKSADRVSWYENDGSENFAVHIVSEETAGVVSIFPADMDGDMDIDIVSAAPGDSLIFWHENDGNENFTRHVLTDELQNPVSVYGADFDEDQDMDIISASRTDGKVSWHENNGNGTFTLHPLFETEGAYVVYAADVNGDGDMDGFSASYEDDWVLWYDNVGNGNLIPHTVKKEVDQAVSVFAADIDLDGHVDVVSASAYNDEIYWHRNGGQEVIDFKPHPVIADRFYNPSAVHAADLDNDGDMDVIAAGEYLDEVVWFENLTITGIYVKKSRVSNRVHAFPNPTDGAITIQADHGVVFHVTDVTGAFITKVKAGESGETQLDLSSYPNGVYLVSNKENGVFIRIVKANTY